jgi:hypothetical protein
LFFGLFCLYFFFWGKFFHFLFPFNAHKLKASIMCDTSSAIDLTAISDDEESVVILIRPYVSLFGEEEGDDFEDDDEEDDEEDDDDYISVKSAPFLERTSDEESAEESDEEESEWVSSDEEDAAEEAVGFSAGQWVKFWSDVEEEAARAAASTVFNLKRKFQEHQEAAKVVVCQEAANVVACQEGADAFM